MNGSLRFLRFGWWNLHNFAHFDANRISDPRWPARPDHYAAKRERLLTTFPELFGSDLFDLLAVCEITREAARDLVTRLPPGFNVTVPPPYPHDDGFQVAVFFRSGVGFSLELPLIPTDMEDVAEGTRPMVPIHLTLPGQVIRFVACHWTAFDTDASRLARERLADVLRRDVHAFLEPEVPPPGIARHVVVVGDLNEEPMSSVFESRLIGRRDRESSHDRHWRDAQVRRVRLYNAAWRYLGEQVAHGTSGAPIGAAGTYFKGPHDWRTFDHVLVSCGLLGANPPYLDEARTGVVSIPTLRDGSGVPRPFEPGSACGVSDHLPIVGRFVLPENPK
jgi:endonuclease/exonuclease/phosphatase family metal-dependent hydrolase